MEIRFYLRHVSLYGAIGALLLVGAVFVARTALQEEELIAEVTVEENVWIEVERDIATTTVLETVQKETVDGKPVSHSTNTVAPVPSAPDVVPDVYKETLATVFWVGEKATRENGFIANNQSAWDSSWQEHFGGIDDPDDRCGFLPCDFTPKENPFYVALPYNDLTDDGERKASASRIPWRTERSGLVSMLKNTWVEVRHGTTTCYGQWEDVGPFESDDIEYVFGEASPRNTFGVGAGIDVSPALRDCLFMPTNVVVQWKFIDSEQVPQGPWSAVVTTRGVTWE